MLAAPSRPSPSSSVSTAMISDDLFVVLGAFETLGYIHKVGNVYVSLLGSSIDHAVEVEQSLSWDRAIESFENWASIPSK
jgi:hypothetical protein